MNITEANAANVFLRIVTGESVETHHVRAAGAVLARGANKVLHAGYDEARFLAAFDENRREHPARYGLLPSEHVPRCNRLCGGGEHHLQGDDALEPIQHEGTAP